jgi:hypothetical protein
MHEVYYTFIIETSFGVSVLIKPVPLILVKQGCHHFWDYFCLICHWDRHITVLMLLVTSLLSFVRICSFVNL